MTISEISFRSSDLTLRGTLNASGSEPGPAALLISGSGPIDRDSNTKRFSINVMSEVADKLAADGIASLRYDKRGVGESEGAFHATGFHDNVDDARAALDALRARPEVDAEQVVVIGHSEGAIVASMLAADAGLAGVALLAGPAHNGKEVLQWQAEQIVPTLPKPVKWLLKLLRQDVVRTQSKRLDRIESSTSDVVRIQFVKINAKWFREFMAFEPADALRSASVPVLAITGAKDIQVDPTDVRLMEDAVPTEFEGHVVDDVTHLLRKDSGPATLRTYKKQARRPIDQGVLQLLADWVLARTCPADPDGKTIRPASPVNGSEP